MMNTYTELLEQIIIEMPPSDANYREWVNFLRRVYPESRLFKNDRGKTPSVQNSRADPANNIERHDEPKEYFNLLEIIQLAADYKHPDWYIQPHFTGPTARFTYENDELKNALAINGVPQIIAGFSGMINGVWLDEQTFIACDIENEIGFLQKMERLKNAGFAVAEFVLFPTIKLKAMSVSKLEMSLVNFIAAAREKWAKVDGAVIVSDTPLFDGEGDGKGKRIIFKPNNQSIL